MAKKALKQEIEANIKEFNIEINLDNLQPGHWFSKCISCDWEGPAHKGAQMTCEKCGSPCIIIPNSK